MPLDNPTIVSNSKTPPPLTGHALKLSKLTIDLSELISRETNLLHARKPQEAKLLHGDKARLMAEYKETLGKLRLNEQLLGAKDSEERKYMRDLTDKFREIIREHARVVLRLKSVTEGLIRSVGEEVTKKNSPVMGYGRNASMQPTRVAKPTSLSLNQVI